MLKQLCDLHRVRFLQAIGDIIAAVDAHADREIAAARTVDALNDLADNAHPVFEAAAVFIGAHIAVRAEKLVQQITVRTVELHAVGVGLLGIHGAGDEFVDHAVDLLARHFVRHAAVAGFTIPLAEMTWRPPLNCGLPSRPGWKSWKNTLQS